MPGMPMGSPGMEHPDPKRHEAYDVLAFGLQDSAAPLRWSPGQDFLVSFGELALTLGESPIDRGGWLPSAPWTRPKAAPSSPAKRLRPTTSREQVKRARGPEVIVPDTLQHRDETARKNN